MWRFSTQNAVWRLVSEVEMFIWTQDDMGRPPAGRTWKSSMSQNQIRLVRAPATGSHKLNLDGWYKGSTLSRYWKKWNDDAIVCRQGDGDALFDMWPIVWKSVQKGFLTDAETYRRSLALLLMQCPYPQRHLILFFLTLHIRINETLKKNRHIEKHFILQVQIVTFHLSLSNQSDLTSAGISKLDLGKFNKNV